MGKKQFVKVSLIILMLLLTVGIGSRMFSSQSTAIAGSSKLQYKVVSSRAADNPEQY